MRCKVLGTGNSPSATTVQFISPQASSNPWQTTENQFVAVPAAGFITALRIRIAAAPGVGKSREITLRKNSVDVMSVTVSDNDTTGLSTVQVAVVPGDLLSLRSTPTNSPASGMVSWCMDFQGTNLQQAIFLAASTASATTVGYNPVMANEVFGGSAPANEVLISEPGTISGLCVALSVPSSASRTFTLRKNGINTTVSVSFAAGQQALQDNVNSVSVAAGDKLVVVLGGSAVAFVWIALGMVFTPTAGDGYSSITCGCSNSPSTTVTNYQTLTGAAGGWDATEANKQHVMNACLIKKLKILLGTAPGVGKSWRFNVKVNGATVGLEVIISDANTTGEVNLDVPITAGDIVAFESVPTGTPTSTGRFEWAISTFQLNGGAGRSFGVMMFS